MATLDNYPDYYKFIVHGDMRRLGGGGENQFNVEARLDKDFSFNLSAKYSDQYQFTPGGLINLGLRHASGRILTLGDEFSASRWTGTDGIEFTVPVDLVAEKESDNIMGDLRTLQTLVVPHSEGEGITSLPDAISGAAKAAAEAARTTLRSGISEGAETLYGTEAFRYFSIYPPGPYPFGGEGAKLADRVTVQFGDFLTVHDAIIKSVNATFVTILAKNKRPLKIRVDLVISSSSPTSTKYLNRMFGNG